MTDMTFYRGNKEICGLRLVTLKRSTTQLSILIAELCILGFLLHRLSSRLAYTSKFVFKEEVFGLRMITVIFRNSYN